MILNFYFSFIYHFIFFRWIFRSQQVSLPSIIPHKSQNVHVINCIMCRTYYLWTRRTNESRAKKQKKNWMTDWVTKQRAKGLRDKIPLEKKILVVFFSCNFLGLFIVAYSKYLKKVVGLLVFCWVMEWNEVWWLWLENWYVDVYLLICGDTKFIKPRRIITYFFVQTIDAWKTIYTIQDVKKYRIIFRMCDNSSATTSRRK